MNLTHPRRRASDQRQIQALPGDEPWRSGTEMIGALLTAADGPLGEVADVVMEEETCAVTDLLVEAEGTAVLIPLAAIARIDWAERRMYVSLTRAEILRPLQTKL
jgi:hypothetical protein